MENFIDQIANVHWVFWLLVIFLIAILVMFIQDITNKKQTIKHNFPVVGRLRYLLESIGPELRQVCSFPPLAVPQQISSYLQGFRLSILPERRNVDTKNWIIKIEIPIPSIADILMISVKVMSMTCCDRTLLSRRNATPWLKFLWRPTRGARN